MSTSVEVYKKLEEFKPNVVISLSEVQDLDISCKTILQRYLINNESLDSSCINKLQAVLDYMYEQVNIGLFKEVRLFLRKTITIASYLRLLAHLNSASVLTESVVKETFKIIDYGILFGYSIDQEPLLLQTCAEIVAPLRARPSEESFNVPSCSHDELNFIIHTIPIETIECPSMEYFYTKYITTGTPVILENSINQWPALTKWQDQNYFIKLAGPRTVPVELGRDYTDSDWTQKLMTIEDFIKNHIYKTTGPTGYLAQYQLFEQIPELMDDIIEPEYCCFSTSDDPADVMAWYGPKGTVSPLHHDPKRNLFAQVVGKKQLFLFPPKDSHYLYPHEHELLRNTSRIDPRKPDFTKYPKYRGAKPYYCVLQAGQMLYIPPKWWHFVESLSISFSVSFWWD